MKSVNLVKMLMRVMGFWYSSSKLEKYLYNVLMTQLFILMLFALYVQDQELYYSRNNLTMITVVAPGATIILTETTKLTVFIIKRRKVTRLNFFIDRNFWKKPYTRRMKHIISNCDSRCYKSTCLLLFLMSATAFNYVITPLIGLVPNSTSEREFPFPMRYASWLYESPFYEMYFTMEFISILAVDLCICTFTCYLFTINLFTAAQFEMLNVKLASLCNFKDNCKQVTNLLHQEAALYKLKECIKTHQRLINLTKDIENLYCYVMLGQVFGSVVQTCLLGIQILLVKTSLQRSVLSVLFLMGSFVQFYYYCYASDALFQSSQNVANAIYNTKWFKITNPRIRKEFTQLMRIISMRARRPCVITVGKFYPLTLITFNSMIGTSMSYFTILRKFLE